MQRRFQIGDKLVTDDSPSYIIAEVGHNHQGDIEKCKAIFKAAAESGADAVKIQKRDNRTLFTRDMYESCYHSENAYADTYGAHREFLEFERPEYLELIAYAKSLGLLFFSTAFDERSADFLEALDMPAYKIASGDLSNTPLLKKVAWFGKPMLVSTGGANMNEVLRAYDAIMPINQNVCIMQCTSGYPAACEDLNLRVIETFRRAFPELVIGFSSHESGIAMPLIAYMLGARIFEKHFTLNRSWKGSDQAFSLEPSGLRRVVRDLERTRVALGDGVKRPYPSEADPLKKMVKSIVAARHLRAGTVLTAGDLAFRITLPSKIGDNALPPSEIDRLVGRVLSHDVETECIVTLASVDSAQQAA